MGYYQTFILTSLAGLAVIVFILARISKRIFNPMQAMVTSMFFGMNMGLTAGILLGVTFQGDLFLSTVLSMGIGMLAGLICGGQFGVLSSLEGIMSGLMGGMMGAMLGEMILDEQSITLIRIFLLLSVTTIFLFFILPDNKNQRIQNKRWLLKPAILAISIIFYFIGGVSFAENQVSSVSKGSRSIHQNHTNSEGEIIDKTSQVIKIQAVHMKYSETELFLKKNQPVTLVLENLDNIEHDIEIKIPTLNNNHLKHNHEGKESIIHLHAKPKSSANFNFTPVDSGIYEFICTIPGHKESGMIGQVVVK